MAICIERHGHSVDKDGFIHYDDRPIPWERVDALAGRRVDRRRNYAVIDGQVHEAQQFSRACSGCYDGPHTYDAEGFGCSECGYTGRRREGFWHPLDSSPADKNI